MYRRLVDVLIVLWLAGGYFLLAQPCELTAAPGPFPCDKECRNVKVMGIAQGGGSVHACLKRRHAECLTCTFSLAGGCSTANPAVPFGLCDADPTLTYASAIVTGAIVCPTPVVGVSYEAATADNPELVEDENGVVHRCFQ